MAKFMPQLQNQVVATETGKQPKIFSIWPFTKKQKNGTQNNAEFSHQEEVKD